MPKTKVLMLTGDAAESLEVMYPYQRLKEEGYEVEIAAPQKKKLRFVVHDFESGFETYTEKPGYTWDADLSFADVNPADYVALVIPGGRAPEHIRNHSDNCQPGIIIFRITINYAFADGIFIGPETSRHCFIDKNNVRQLVGILLDKLTPFY